jgi:hypothetical protein
MVRAALVSGTALSLGAVTAWSCMANLAVGPPAPLHLTRNLPADYAALAAAPAGSGIALFAVVAVIYTACFAVAGLRRMRREAAEAREYDRAAGDAEGSR